MLQGKENWETQEKLETGQILTNFGGKPKPVIGLYPVLLTCHDPQVGMNGKNQLSLTLKRRLLFLECSVQFGNFEH